MSAIAGAEAATLGSLLLDPPRLSELMWLQERDFADPWHGAIFELIREHHADPTPVTAGRLGELLTHRIGLRRAALHRIVDLLQAVPVRPQPAVYAGMVLDASIRRHIAAQGVLLRAGALQTALTSSASPIITTTAILEHTVNGLQFRWDQAHARITTPPVPQVPLNLRPVLRNRHLALCADRLLAAHRDLDPRDAGEHEQDLIAALVTRPQYAEPIAAWLKPEHLRQRRWAVTYTAVLELLARGEPVDAVTVTWRTHQLGLQAGPGPAESDFREAVEANLAADPAWLARSVAADQIRHLADTTAAALSTAAANPGLDISDLLTTTQLHATAIKTVASRAPLTGPEPGAEEQTLTLLTGLQPPADPLPHNRIPTAGRAM